MKGGRPSVVVVAAAAAVVLLAGTAHAALENGCLRLLGSAACPGFASAYLSPGNLSNAFPFFADVTDVASFDSGAFGYFSNPYQYQTTKFADELGCTNATSNDAVIRWQRTVLCSQWVNEKWSIDCTNLYNASVIATAPKMVCQSTCLEYSASESQVVNDTLFCPGPDLTNGNRSANVYKDYVDCTNWTTLATNDTTYCVPGESNEGSCGYGSSTTQLCAFCSASTPDDCCYSSNTDVSVCGYVLPTRANSSTSGGTSSTASPNPSGTLQGSGAGSNTTGLSHGQIAGIVVGSVLGGLLLLALLIFLFLFCRRRRNPRRNRDSASSFNAGPAAGAGGAGLLGGIFAKNVSGSDGRNPNSSEKGLLGTHQSAAAASSPTMGGDTLYSGHHGGVGSTEGVMGTTAAAGVGAGAGAGAGLGAGAATGAFAGLPAGTRTSGIVLPRVRDENQSGDRWIETGSEVTVLWPYQASLPDELDLRPGMKLRVLRLYDDAWGTAQVISSDGTEGRSGAFPIVCVSEGSSFGSTPSSTASH